MLLRIDTVMTASLHKSGIAIEKLPTKMNADISKVETEMNMVLVDHDRQKHPN